jgi:probable HAF family extracellular repeat protein
MAAPRRFPALLLVLVLLLAMSQVLPIAAQQATPSPDGGSSLEDDPGKTGRQPGPAPSGELKVHWTVSSDFAAGTDPTPAVSKTSISINSAMTNMVGAYDASTGDALWSFETGRSFSPPVASEGAVYVSSVNGLWSLDERTGEPIWLMDGATPLGVDDGVFYGASVSDLFAAEAATGTVIWQRPADSYADLAIDDNRLYIGTSTGVVILDRADGHEIARVEGEEDLLHFPAVDQTGLYVTTNTSVSAFELDGFEQRWTVELPELVSRAAIGDDAVFASSGSGLHALDIETGQERWRLEGAGAGRPLIAGGSVYVVIDSQLTAVSAVDGAIEWTFSSRVAPLVAIANGLIYLGPEEGSGRTLAVGGSAPVQPTTAGPSEAPLEADAQTWTKPENGPCDVEPRSAEQIESLQPPSGGTDPSSELTVPALVEEIPDSAAASQEIVDAITAIARMEIACLNEGAELQRLALWTDEYFYRTLLDTGMPADQVIASLSAAIAPPLVRQRQLIEVRDVRALPDGTVAAIVIFESRFISMQSPHPGPIRADLIIFRETAAGWHVDGRIIDVDADLISSTLANADAASLASPPSETLELAGVPMYRVDPDRSGVNPGPLPEGLPVQLWRTDIGENELRSSSPTVSGNLVFAGGETAFYALDVNSGEIRWTYEYQGTGQRSDAVVVPSDVLMWDAFGVRLLSLQTGQLLWENRSLPATPTSISVANDVAFVGGFDVLSASGKVVSIDVRSGVVLWTIELPIGQPQIPAAIKDGVVYLTTFDLAGGTYDGSLYAVDAATGSMLWSREHLNSLASPVISGETLYVAEFEGSVYAINTASGETVWRSELPGRSSSSILVANGQAYAATGTGELFAFDAGSGALQWKVQTAGTIWLSSPSTVGNTIVAGTIENMLLALDASDGRELWRFEAGGQIRSTPSIVDGRIFFQSDDGYLYALGAAGDTNGQPAAATPPVPTEEEAPETTLELSAEFGVTVQLGSFWQVASSEEGVAVLVGGGSTLTLRVDSDSGIGAFACVTGARVSRTFLGPATEMARLQGAGTSHAPTASVNRASGAWEVQYFFDPDRAALQIDCRILETMPGSRFTAVAYTPLIELANDAPMIEMLLESMAVETPQPLPGSPAPDATTASPTSEYAVTVSGPATAESVSLPSINDQGQIVASIVDADDFAPHAFIVDGDAVTYLSDDAYAGSAAASVNEQGEVAGIVLGEDGLPHAALWSGGNVTLLQTDGQAPSMSWVINNGGVIAGAIALSTGIRSGAVWTGGELKILGEPGIWTDANDLNASGTIVGWGSTYVGSNQAIVWAGSEVIGLESPEDGASNAQHINDAGLIAGTIASADDTDHAAVWIDGVMTDLGTLGGETSDVDDLNEAGQVLGDADTADGSSHSFLWSDGTMTDLGLFDDNPVNGQDLNDAGQVAGWAVAEDGSYHAVVWHDGMVTDLGTGGGVQAWAHSINNLGQVAGIVEMEDGTRQIARWDPESPPELLPVPSPTPSPLPTATATAIPEPPGGGAVILLLDIYFEPRQVTIAANTDATVRLVNEGAAPHSFVIDELGISVSLAPGESADVVINAPPGEYQFVCDVPGHTEAGMVGVLVVE